MGSEIGRDTREIGDFMGNTTKGRLTVAALGITAVLLIMATADYQQQIQSVQSSKDVSQPLKK